MSHAGPALKVIDVVLVGTQLPGHSLRSCRITIIWSRAMVAKTVVILRAREAMEAWKGVALIMMLGRSSSQTE